MPVGESILLNRVPGHRDPSGPGIELGECAEVYDSFRSPFPVLQSGDNEMVWIEEHTE
jgi:hypothetical protein